MLGVGATGGITVRRRARDQRGTTIAEMVVVMSLLLVVVTMIVTAISSTQRQEKTAVDLARAVGEARAALDHVVREVRAANGLVAGTGGIDAVAWYDTNGDTVEQPSELVSYDLDTSVSPSRLLRIAASGTRVLAEFLQPGSRVAVTQVNAGVLLHLTLAVDVDAAVAPEETVVETEVLARDA